MTIGRTVASDVDLTLGLVRTTVSLKPRRAGEGDATGLKRICPVHAARNIGVKIQQTNVCPKVDEHTAEEGREPFTIPDLASGRETSKNTVVPLTEAEIEYIRQVEGATSKAMELNFHPAAQVAHLIPTGKSYAAFSRSPDNFYGVLAHHLARLDGLVCMGTLVLSGKAKNFFVTVNEFGIVLTEVCRDQDLYEVPLTDMTADARFIPTAGALIAAVTTDYDEALYYDNSGARLAEILAEKAANPDATVTPITTVERPVPADNMLALLEASLAAAKGAA
jgi:non-homologous end joining protein Ku